MTPEEWKQGIQNEAQALDDEQWSAETLTHLRRQKMHSAVLQGAGAVTVGMTVGVSVLLLTQLPILGREAARNGVDLLTFLRWNALGHPQPVHTVISSSDPVFPVTALLILLFVLSGAATRAGLPHGPVLLAAGTATLGVAALSNLILPVFTGVPALPLLVTLGTAALGVVLFRGPRPGPASHTQTE